MHQESYYTDLESCLWEPDRKIAKLKENYTKSIVLMIIFIKVLQHLDLVQSRESKIVLIVTTNLQ